MSTAKKLAAEFGLKTADVPQEAGNRKAEAPPEKIASAAPGAKGQPLRWTQQRRDIFNFLGPVSLSLVATDGPVSITLYDRLGDVKQRFGHNRGVWPARLERGATRNDAATTKWDRNPFFFLGSQSRLWFLTEAERDRTAASVLDLIAARAESDGGLETLKKGFADLGPDLDLELFELEMLDIARRVGAVCFDDAGLVKWFDEIARRCSAIAAERGNVKWGHKLVERVAAADLEKARQGAR